MPGRGSVEFSEVRARVGGLKGVIEKLGDAPPNHKWKSFPQCPFCGHKDSAGIWAENGAEFFKCHFPDCNTGRRTVTEVGYVAMRLGLSEDKPTGGGPSPAYQKLLELAGAWEEPKPKAPKPPMPTSKPGTEPRPGSEPRLGNEGPSSSAKATEDRLPNPVLPEPSEPSDEDLLRDAIEVIHREQKASARVLMRGLGLGYLKADRVLAELERRGVIGPINGNQPREILNLGLPSSVKAAEGGPASESPGAEPRPGTPVSEPDVGANGQGSDDPGAAAGPTAPEVVAQCSGPAFIEGAPAAPNLGLASESPQAEALPPAAVPAAKPDPKEVKLEPGVVVLRDFFSRLELTTEQMVPYLPDGQPVPDPLSSALVRELRYQPVSLELKRGLFPQTCALLGFKANRRSNEKLLLEIGQQYDWEERMASGLWKEASIQRRLDRRPDKQFCGQGQVGRKPEDERRDQDDKAQWGYCEPPLIPYFNEFGELVKLRPHKGGARGGTAAGSERIYVPRAYQFCADLPPEKFSTVIICEGEFKAAVLWQSIGGGAALTFGYQTPYGVCALPGISFARNEDYREDLEEWLLNVGCKVVIVGFDDEDKSDKPLRQRFDSVIFAQYLAIDLSKKLNLVGKYLKLPTEWRNAKGKADWDGAAAMMGAEVDRTWNDAQPQ